MLAIGVMRLAFAGGFRGRVEPLRALIGSRRIPACAGMASGHANWVRRCRRAADARARDVRTSAAPAPPAAAAACRPARASPARRRSRPPARCARARSVRPGRGRCRVRRFGQRSLMRPRNRATRWSLTASTLGSCIGSIVWRVARSIAPQHAASRAARRTGSPRRCVRRGRCGRCGARSFRCRRGCRSSARG